MKAIYRLSQHYFSLVRPFRQQQRLFSTSIINMSGQLIDEGDPHYEKLHAPYLKLYSLGTPNGVKVTIYLELLGLKYYYRRVDITTNEQKEPWFIKLNPNGRIPTLTDVDKNGKLTSLFETGAILLYLGEKYDTERKYYYPIDHPLYWDQLKWLMFHVASHAPYQGQANHFLIYAKEKVQYGIDRYKAETERVYGVFEIRLKENNGWLVGDRLNIADFAAYAWIRLYNLIGIDIDQFPAVKAWLDKLESDPAIAKGVNVDNVSTPNPNAPITKV